MQTLSKQPLPTPSPSSPSPSPTPAQSGMAPKKRQFIPWIAAVLVALVCLAVLYGGTNQGLADNGDFYRVMRVNRIFSLEDGKYQFQQYYTMQVEGDGFFTQAASLFATDGKDEVYSSPQFWFVKASKLLNYCYNRITGQPADNYNLLWLALLYILLLAAAAFLIVSFFHTRAVQWTATACFLFFFCDAGYLLYFNSFYGEPLQYVILLLAVGLSLRLYRRPGSIPAVVLLFICLYFFAGAKLANIPLTALAALASLTLITRTNSGAFQIVLPVLVLGCLVSLALLFASIPKWMDKDTTYQSVFYGILRESPTPASDLLELGLDLSCLPLQNTHAYMPSYPVDIRAEKFQIDFFEQVGKLDITTFYLRHPVRFAEKLGLAARHSSHIRPPSLATSAAGRMEQTRRFSLWSILRVRSVLLYTPWVVIGALLLLTLLCLCLICRLRGWLVPLTGGAWLLSAAWASLALPVICNGEADLAKHMFLFVSLIDLMIAAGLLALAMNCKKVCRLVRPGLLFCKRHKCFTVLVCIGLCGAILLSAVLWERPQTILFGNCQGIPLRWRVVSDELDSQLLVCENLPVALPFDDTSPYGSNLWSDSSLRRWLNSGFLDSFSAQEKNRLLPVINRVLLSEGNAGESEGGTHSHFWDASPETAASLWDTAYYQTVTDTVSLLPITAYQEISRRFGPWRGDPFWLLDAYGNNDTMVRCTDRDGYVLHKDAAQPLAVRPVIRLRKDQ